MLRVRTDDESNDGFLAGIWWNSGEMCNAYEMGGKTGSFPGFLRAKALRELESFVERRLIRRTDVAPVVRSDGEVEMMSWGFRRKSLGVVNNSRTDNLESPMWREAYQERRCLIPVACYFEWKGPQGQKQTYRFESSAGDCFWMAGIWEESQEFGRCFSMLTTMANRVVLPIHHRMPVILGAENWSKYLKGEEALEEVKEGAILVKECANPLIKKPKGPIQDELF